MPKKVASGPSSYAKKITDERALKDQFMLSQPESPFREENLPFEALKYFPVDPAWRIKATFTEAPSREEVWLRTSQDGHASMKKLGTLSFKVGAKACKLTLFHAGPQAGNIAFLPFRDATSGKATYGPGRYLNVELVTGKNYVLDFNQVFNPYCAYTDAYECPYPPPENDLPVEVKAGEKVYDEKNNPPSPEHAIRGLTLRFRERLAERATKATPPHPGS